MTRSRSADGKISVSVHFVHAVLRHAIEYDYFPPHQLRHTLEVGLDPQELLRRHRIPPRLLREEQARISVQQFADLSTGTMQAMDDEALGYARQRMPLGTWDMMCHAVITCATLGQALHRYCRYFQLFEGGLPIRLQVDDSVARLVLGEAAVERGAYFAELSFLNTHRFACWLTQEELPLRRAVDDGPVPVPMNGTTYMADLTGGRQSRQLRAARGRTSHRGVAARQTRRADPRIAASLSPPSNARHALDELRQ